MLRITLQPKRKLSKEELDNFKKGNPELKIRLQKGGNLFVYIDERACSSGVERCSDIAKVEGAKPSTPTN
jgi:hypothetical protein